MNKKLFLILCFGVALLAFASGDARAQNTLRIAAVVNDDIITVYDLNARLNMVAVSSGIERKRENMRRLAPRVLQTLIEDKLKTQESKRQKITVSKSRINLALSGIAKNNNIPRRGLDAFFKKNNIDKDALIEQIKADVGWSSVVDRSPQLRVKVSREEVDEVLEGIRTNKGKQELLVSEIFLPVDSPDKDAESAQIANRLIQQLKQGGRFDSLARSFSQGASAAVGGDLGWVRQGQLPDALDAAIAKLNPNQITIPVRSVEGYHILLLRSRRIAPGIEGGNISVRLQQLFLPLAKNAAAPEVSQRITEASSLTAQAKSCPDMETLGKTSASSLSGSLGTVLVSKLPIALRQAVSNLAVGTPSTPVRTADGVIVLMICERTGQSSLEAARKAIEQRLRNERSTHVARRLMRDLRRAAFIDIRL